jgi:hypothetical protein
VTGDTGTKSVTALETALREYKSNIRIELNLIMGKLSQRSRSRSEHSCVRFRWLAECSTQLEWEAHSTDAHAPMNAANSFSARVRRASCRKIPCCSRMRASKTNHQRLGIGHLLNASPNIGSPLFDSCFVASS